MQRHRRLSQRLVYFYVLFAALLLALVGGLAVYSGRQALEAATISSLASTATEKQAALDTWLAERQEDIVLLIDTAYLQEHFTNFASATPDSPTAKNASVNVINDLNPQVGTNKQFLAMSVLEPATGRVLIATDPTEVGKFRESEAAFINGKVAPYIDGPYYSLQFQSPIMTIGGPLRSAQGQLLGVLVGRLNLSKMTSIILRRSDVQQTQDAYLVNAADLFVTQPRFISDSVVLQRGDHTEAVQRCLTGNSGVISDNDYRGVPAIAVFRWLADHQLCLVVKLDRSEALAPSNAFGLTILLISGLALVMASVMALGLARTITRPISALQSGAARFAKGELDMRLPETSDDELGLLAREFNAMAASLAAQDKQLRTYTGELEQLVQERTAALVASGTELRALFSAMTDVILVFDSTGRLIRIAPTTPAAIFKPSATLVGKRLHDLYPAVQADEFLAGIQQVLAERQTNHYEYQIEIRDAIYWFDASISPLSKDSVLLVGRDITANKKAETALREESVLRASEERFRGLFDKAPIAISVTQGVLRLYVNPAYLRMFGYNSVQEMAGVSVADHVALSHRPAFMEIARNAPPPANQVITFETLGLRQDGTPFTANVQLARLDLPDGPANIVFIEDITERKHAEIALRQNEEKLQTFFEMLPVGVSVLDNEGQIVQMNPALERIMDISMQGLLSGAYKPRKFIRSDGTPMPPTDIPSVRALAEQRTIHEIEIGVIKEDGAIVWTSVSAAPLPLAQSGVIIVTTDITERKRAEEQLAAQTRELARSNQELEQFAYIASHDLQEPLRMVTSFMGLLSRRYQGKLDEKADTYIGYAVDGATRMQQLINDLLAFSRVGSRAKEFTLSDLESVLAHVLRNLSVAVKESKAQITHDPLPTIMADATQLEQLFQNLIANAIKFQGEAAPQVHISAEQQGSQWLFAIQDNGIGIDPGSAEEVFGIFKRLHTRREYAGTGLGLAICKKIVERHNGRIWLDSKPGKGSTFYFSLPIENHSGSHKS